MGNDIFIRSSNDNSLVSMCNNSVSMGALIHSIIETEILHIETNELSLELLINISLKGISCLLSRNSRHSVKNVTWATRPSLKEGLVALIHTNIETEILHIENNELSLELLINISLN